MDEIEELRDREQSELIEAGLDPEEVKDGAEEPEVDLLEVWQGKRSIVNR